MVNTGNSEHSRTDHQSQYEELIDISTSGEIKTKVHELVNNYISI